jgi:hypothetical protein
VNDPLTEAGGRVQFFLAVALSVVLTVSACSRHPSDEERIVAAPIRLLSTHRLAFPASHAICVGMQEQDGIKDFPAGVLDDVFAHNPAMHPLSFCKSAPKMLEPVGNRPPMAGAIVCGISAEPHPNGSATQVDCDVQFLTGSIERFEVSRHGNGEFVAKFEGTITVE